MLNNAGQYSRLIVLSLITILSTGCASIAGSPVHTVRIDSQPNNASYSVNDEAGEVVATGTTPDAVVLRTSKGYFDKSRYYVTIDLAGYQSQTNKLNAEVSGWYLANLVAGYMSFVGLLIIDPFTGAMYTLPDELITVLESSP